MNTSVTVAATARSRPELAVLLRFLRKRIDRNARALGPHARLPARLGRRVTQDELAEAIGVTREWYAMLECGSATTRASTRLVDRLADALMVNPEERARLFALAVPELGHVALRDDSVAALEAFSRLRTLSKRLWTATSIDDVLTTAIEQIATSFDGVLLVAANRRHEGVPWTGQTLNNGRAGNNATKILRDVKAALLESGSAQEQELVLSEALYDAVNLYPRLEQAGDIGTPDLWPSSLRQEMVKVCARHRVGGFAGRYVRVRTRSGLIGGLYMAHEYGHSYSRSDNAVFGAFAELVSYAIS